eukprot:2737815-Pyramimonas_sp.AAC.1
MSARKLELPCNAALTFAGLPGASGRSSPPQELHVLTAQPFLFPSAAALPPVPKVSPVHNSLRSCLTLTQ